MIDRIDVCVPSLDGLPLWWYENLKRLPIHKLIVDMTKPLGEARRKCIEKVETEWFAFIDDDVLISKLWFKEMVSHIADDIGAIACREQLRGYGKSFDKALNSFRWGLGNRELRLGQRGITVCTLFRTEAVKDWKPSHQDLSSFEDYELTQHVLKKGYKWLDVNAHATHYSWRWITIPKASFWHCKGLKLLRPRGNFYLPYYMIRLLASPIRMFWKAFIGRHNFRVAIHNSWVNLWILIGLMIT